MKITNLPHTVNDSAIPPYIQEKLNEGPPGKGNRHDWWKDLTLQMAGEGMARQAIFDILRALVPDTDKPDQELWKLIDGAYKRNPKPATTSLPGSPSRSANRVFDRVTKKEDGGFVVKTFKRQSLHVDDIPKLDVSIETFLSKMFKPGETISICLESQCVEGSDKWIPRDSGHFAKLEKWKELLERRPHLEERYQGQAGVWIRINPVKDDNTSGSDDSVTDFRNVLVEFDSLPKSDQWDIYKQSGLPIGAVIDSGGKSLHAWVTVNAKDREEYRHRQERIYAFLAEYMDDKGNHNPSRFSRLPGVTRAGKPQHVVAFDIGAKDWHEWESANLDDGLPPEIDLAEMLTDETIVEAPHLIQGFLRRGQVAIFSGASKTNKSWTMMEMALSVSQGIDFLKWKVCLKGGEPWKVYYVDTELEVYDFKYRMDKIAKAKGASIDLGEITPILLRGVSTDIDKLTDCLIRRLHGKSYDLICIDAIYSLLGKREENSNEDITSLGSQLLRLATVTGSAVAIVHHFSKGSQAKKRGIEKASGAGAWGRFPDVSLAIDSHTDDGYYNFESDCRTFAPQDPFVAERVNGIWVIADGKKVKRGSDQEMQITELLDVLENDCGGKATVAELDAAAELSLGHSKSSVLRFRKKAQEAKLIEKVKLGRTWVYKLVDGVVKNPDTGHYEHPRATVTLSRK